MDIRKLQRAIVDGLEDVKAQQIVVFNTEHLSSMFERVIIASGTSNRQTKALAASVRNSVKGRGMQVMATEGEDNGEWIIVDCGAAVAHIMQPAIREYYHLEEIWGGKPVRLAKGDKPMGLVKASEPEAAPKIASKKTTAGKTQSASSPLRAAALQPSGRAAAPAAPKKKPAGRSKAELQAATEQKSANRTAAFKRVAAKSSTSGAARRETQAPAGKTLVVKPAAKTANKPVSRPATKTVAKPVGKTAAARPAAKKISRPATKAVARKTPARKSSARKSPQRGG